MNRKGDHVMGGKNRDRAQRMAFAERTLAPIGHRQEYRRVDPCQRNLASGHRDDLARAAGGAGERDAVIARSGGQRKPERGANARIVLQYALRCPPSLG